MTILMSLLLAAAGGELVLRRPTIYQEVDGARRPIPGGYVLDDGVEIGFEIAAYDQTRPLTIDPVLMYSTYLGGSNDDVVEDIAVDSSGAAYVTGTTLSTNFPVANALQSARSGLNDVFVAKINTTNDLRIKIPAGFGMTWDTLDTTATFGGTAAVLDRTSAMSR